MTTPQQRLDSLLADVWQPTDAVVTVAEIVATVGMDPARLVVGTLQAGAAQDPILAASYQAITTVGMSLSSPERQGLIDALATAGEWPDAVRDSVKALGGAYVKEWQRQGMEVAPTLESVQATIDAENADPDETKHEVLISVNRGTDGTMRVMARVTPVHFADGVLLRRGQATVIANNAELIAALSPIIEGLMQ